MKLTTNMRGFQRWIDQHPRKKLTGYFSINGKPMTHEQVVRAVNYAVDKGYETEADIPNEELFKLFGNEFNENV